MIAGIQERGRFDRLDALASAVLALGMAAAWQHPEVLEPAWRAAIFFFLGPSIGVMALAAMHGLTGGEWGTALRRPLAFGCRVLPWALALALPCVFARLSASAPGTVLPTARTVFVGGALLLIANRLSLDPPQRRAWVPPVALIAIFFVNHLLADDWLAPANDAPSGTAFPLVWLIGQAVSALALALIVGLRTGLNPRRRTGPSRTLGLDLGTLLFAAAMLWCYVAFAQFLIIWSGNLPSEVAWYVLRREEPWRWIPPLLVVLYLVAPMAVLLSRRAKNSASALHAVAILLVIAQVLYTTWIVLPESGVRAVLLAAGFAAGLLAVGRRMAWVKGGAR